MFIIKSYNFSLFFSETFLESFTPSIIESGGIITPATTTGPANGPLPASSIPAIYFIPLLHNSSSNLISGIIIKSCKNKSNYVLYYYEKYP